MAGATPAQGIAQERLKPMKVAEAPIAALSEERFTIPNFFPGTAVLGIAANTLIWRFKMAEYGFRNHIAV
jgi:hypothetical protein